MKHTSPKGPNDTEKFLNLTQELDGNPIATPQQYQRWLRSAERANISPEIIDHWLEKWQREFGRRYAGILDQIAQKREEIPVRHERTHHESVFERSALRHGEDR